MEERWVKVVDFPDYSISDHGRVRRDIAGRRAARTGTILKLQMKHLYHGVVLWNNGAKKDERCHRLVAQHFIPNPLGLTEVNHIDGNKLNNHYQNLEWCSHAQNMGRAARADIARRQMYRERKWKKYFQPAGKIKTMEEILQENPGLREKLESENKL